MMFQIARSAQFGLYLNRMKLITKKKRHVGSCCPLVHMSIPLACSLYVCFDDVKRRQLHWVCFIHFVLFRFAVEFKLILISVIQFLLLLVIVLVPLRSLHALFKLILRFLPTIFYDVLRMLYNTYMVGKLHTKRSMPI